MSFILLFCCIEAIGNADVSKLSDPLNWKRDYTRLTKFRQVFLGMKGRKNELNRNAEKERVKKQFQQRIKLAS